MASGGKRLRGAAALSAVALAAVMGPSAALADPACLKCVPPPVVAPGQDNAFIKIDAAFNKDEGLFLKLENAFIKISDVFAKIE